MRIKLLREGVATVDGRIIERGSIEWPDIIPVMNTEGNIVSNVTKIRREGMGWVTGEVAAPRKDLRGFAAQANLDKVGDPETNGEAMVIKSGRLVSIVMGQTPTWPGMVVQ